MANPSKVFSTGGLFSKVSLLLTSSMVVSALGTYMGQGITSGVGIFALGVLFFIGAFLVPGAAKKSKERGIVYLTIWTFISGLFMGPAIHQYVQTLGWNTVFAAYIGTGAVMAACGSIGALSGINFNKLGGFLLFALLALICVGLVGIFIPLSHTVNIVYCLAGMGIFALFFMFDFYRVTKSEDTWAEAINATMQIYLDYINFLLFLLRFLGIKSKD